MVRLNFLSRKQFNQGYEDGSMCSGTIFHENYIMTAAHCCRYKYLVHVHFNDHSRSVEDKNESKFTIMNTKERLSDGPVRTGVEIFDHGPDHLELTF